MVNVGMFYDHLEYFMAIWYNSWQFGTVRGHLLYFSQFGMFGPKKSGNPVVGSLTMEQRTEATQVMPEMANVHPRAYFLSYVLISQS
jgi:hypothetical protein